MAGQGCPGEGSDTRLLGRWGCAIQRALTWHCDEEPGGIMFCTPFYVCVNIKVPYTTRKYWHLRAGTRYDKNFKGYIFPEFASKVKDQPIWY